MYMWGLRGRKNLTSIVPNLGFQNSGTNLGGIINPDLTLWLIKKNKTIDWQVGLPTNESFNNYKSSVRSHATYVCLQVGYNPTAAILWG